VAYALVAMKEAARFHKELQNMFSHLATLAYKGKLLNEYNFYCMGQVCIDKAYRGQGVFNMLYQHHKNLYGDAFDMLVTSISTSNIRSQRAHEKVGFKTIYNYRDASDEWNVVVWDWKY
jgi:GNAT superfamily N-acetyltransferase